MRVPDLGPMGRLAAEVSRALTAVFEKDQEGLIFRELVEGERPSLRATFVLYDFWEIDFSSERGIFGFGIPFRDSSVSLLLGPTDTLRLDDLERLFHELDERVRLRIPDKYLAAREAGDAPRIDGSAGKGAAEHAHRVVRALRDILGTRVSRLTVQDLVDSDGHVEFSVVFEIYNYFPVRFNYDRGSFGFAIVHGERGVSITPAGGHWPPLSELPLVLRHLDREIRSRIPYGFLESHGWAEPVASEIVLDPALITFAAQAGYRPHHDVTSLTLANAGGEIRYTVAAVPDGYLLTRADRAGEPEELMWAVTLSFVEVFLVELMSPSIRHRRLPRISLPHGWDEAADGFEPFRAEGRWTGLRRDGVALPVRLVDRDIVHPVIGYSHLLGGSLREVIDSFSAPDGAPLLTVFVRTAPVERP